MFQKVLHYYLLFLIPFVLCHGTVSRQVSHNRVHHERDMLNEGVSKPFPIPLSDVSVWKHLMNALDTHRSQSSEDLRIDTGLANQECGIANSFQAAQTMNAMKITGGDATLPHQFPWQVVVTSRSTPFLCGGSVISSRWIATAAHCVDGIQEVVIVMGAHNRTAFKEPPGQVQTSQDIFVHPKWNGTSLANDIALIKLPRTIDCSYYVRPICLPSYNDSSDHANEHVTLTGWGRFSDGLRNTSDVLRTVNATVITNQQCAKSYPKIITSSMICVVGDKNKGTCNGDSGGPLNYYDETTGKWTLIGLVSFGSSAGCEKGYPNAFTRVHSYVGWIELTMQRNDSATARFKEALILLWFLVFFAKTSSF